MTWRLPDTYHSAGTRRGTATLKFYEGRDILDDDTTSGKNVSEPATVLFMPGVRGDCH